jgi:hypothetical protein
MKSALIPAAAGIFLALAAATPSTAQVQLNVCGAPPLPPCERRQERVIIDRRGGGDLGTLCRTRSMRCEKDRPRPIGDRCTCEDDDGERVVGRIVR